MKIGISWTVFVLVTPSLFVLMMICPIPQQKYYSYYMIFMSLSFRLLLNLNFIDVFSFLSVQGVDLTLMLETMDLYKRKLLRQSLLPFYYLLLLGIFFVTLLVVNYYWYIIHQFSLICLVRTNKRKNRPSCFCLFVCLLTKQQELKINRMNITLTTNMTSTIGTLVMIKSLLENRDRDSFHT